MSAGYSVKRATPTSEPDVDQGVIHGWPVTWNPDDGRYYVQRADGTAAATFKEFRNAVQWCRNHATKGGG